MARQEEEIPLSERRNRLILKFDPTDLVRDNLALHIVHPGNIHKLEHLFAPGQFQEPIGYWVQVESDHGTERRFLLKDGAHRAFLADKWKGRSLRGTDPHFFDTIEVIDATPDRLGVKTTDPHHRLSISMAHYLEEVIEATVRQREISSRRMAAHILNGWKGMVGNDLARRFSALSALSFLYEDRVSMTTPQQLSKFLNGQPPFVAEETVYERRKIEDALIAISSILNNPKTAALKKAIFSQAFSLVTEESPVIGGKKEVRELITGWLESARVGPKRQQNLPEAARMTDEVLAAFARVSRKRQDVEAIEKAIMNPQLNLKLTREVITADSPALKLVEIFERLNHDNLRAEYMKTRRGRELTPLEEQLIEGLGKKQSPEDIKFNVRVITEAREQIAAIDTYRSELESQKRDLLSRGVDRKTISEAIEKLTEWRAAIVTDNAQTVHKRVEQSRKVVDSIKQGLNEQIVSYQARQVIRRYYSKEIHGTKTEDLVLERIKVTTGLQNTFSIEKFMDEVVSYESGLQWKIMTGEVTLARARQIVREDQERQRRQQDEAKEAKRATTQEVPVKKEPLASLNRIQARTESPRPPVDLRAERVDKGRRHLSNLADNVVSEGRDIDLAPDEVDAPTRGRVVRAANFFQKFLTGKPDEIRRAEDRLIKEQEELRKGTKD